MTQIGTQLKESDLGLFDKIEVELKTIMQKKGYSSLDQFRGKLKTI
jgi:dihydroorotate dehydrogenase (fumarate)